MDKYIIKGQRQLSGEVTVHGAKNSALPILASTILIKGVSVIHNCPDLSDVRETFNILERLGCIISYDGYTAVVDASDVNASNIDESVMRKMRSSIIFLGSLISRLSSASMYFPGGCDIGTRPIDLHLMALRSLGVNIVESGSSIKCFCESIHGNKIVLPFPSVGATENIIIAAAKSNGTTIIINPAREPEIVDLANFLNACGAKISGAGDTTVIIRGVENLTQCEYTIIPDRIEASTYMCAVASAGGEGIIKNIVPSHLTPVIPVFMEMGCKIYLEKNALKIQSPKRLKRVKSIKTMPYPGFPTDSQPLITAALSVAKGTSVINESIFENRFRYVSELNRFGTDVAVNDRMAVINGVKSLHSSTVKATDLRGGAALVIAALSADGVSTVENIYHILRGYENLQFGISSLGGDMKRISNEKSEQ